MFWALVLEAGKHYSQNVENAFHISMASLELPTDQEALKAKRHENVSVMIGDSKSEFLVCTLNYKSLTQQQLDLNFTEGEQVTFFITGSGMVHLTGYNLESELDMEVDEGEQSDEEPELVPETGKKRKYSQETDTGKKKRKRLTPGGGEFIDDSEEDDDSDDDDDDFADFEIEAEEGEEEDDTDESEEDAVDMKSHEKKKDLAQTLKSKAWQATPKAQKDTAATPKTQNVGLGKLSGEGEAKSSQKQKQEETPSSSVRASGDASSTNVQSEKKKHKKKKKKKNRSMTTEEDQQKTQSLQNSKNPQQEKTLQQVKTLQSSKNAQELKSPQQNIKDKDNTPKEQAQQVKTPKKQVLQGGIISEEIHIGDGPVVKPGQMVHVYYVGKLQANGNQFDSCMKGKPFSFKLGHGQVIKGWDTGVQGMKVGGKRRLTIPPSQGYGSERSGPIPPNSTLVFEVELKNIS